MSFYNLMSLHNARATSQAEAAGDGEVMVLSNAEDIHSLLNFVPHKRVATPMPTAEFNGGEPAGDAASLFARIGQLEEKLEQYKMSLSDEVEMITKDLGLLRNFLHSLLEAIQKTNSEMQAEIERRDMLVKRLEELADKQTAVQKEMEKVMSIAKESGGSWLEKLLGVRGGRE